MFCRGQYQRKSSFRVMMYCHPILVGGMSGILPRLPQTRQAGVAVTLPAHAIDNILLVHSRAIDIFLVHSRARDLSLRWGHELPVHPNVFQEHN
jgi:hypothetical protein